MWLIVFIVFIAALAIFDYIANDYLRRIVKQINNNPEFLNTIGGKEACEAALTASRRSGLLDPLAAYYRNIIYTALNGIKS